MHPGTKWFQPEVNFTKVVLMNKLQKKFFQILTPDTILEFWGSKNFEYLTLGILTLPPRSSRVEPRSSSLEPGGSRVELGSSGWNQVVGIQGFPYWVMVVKIQYREKKSCFGLPVYCAQNHQILIFPFF